MENQRSHVWNHFELNQTTKALCKYCEKLISFHGKTSNLIKHMNRKHRDVMERELKEPLSHKTEIKEEQEVINDTKNTSESEQEPTIIVNIDAVCRICLSDLVLDPNPVDCVSLESQFFQGVTYESIFKECTGFGVKESEPQFLCLECAQNLLVSYKLRVKCKETQAILQEWLEIEAEEKAEGRIEVENEEFLIDEDLSDTKLETPKRFLCDICGSRSTSKTGISIHIKTQHLNITLKCKYCDAAFRSRLVLNSHIRRVHSEFKKPLKCEFCDYITPNFPNLFRHRLTHTRKKLHKCETCGREFVTKDNYRTHVATHSNQRPFGCETCNATFKTKKSLGVHRKSHQEPEYECPVCFRGFSTNQVMKNHARRMHPEFVLPPSGTILNKTWRIKKVTQDLKENVLKMGLDPGVVKSVIIDESYLNKAKKYVRRNKITVLK